MMFAKIMGKERSGDASRLSGNVGTFPNKDKKKP
jgi:hypothetical protein